MMIIPNCIYKLYKCTYTAIIYLFLQIEQKMKKDQETGIIAVYKVSNTNASHLIHKGKNYTIPVIFKVRLKKYAEPLYINYATMKQQYRDMLLHFFQMKVFLTQVEEENSKNRTLENPSFDDYVENKDHLIESNERNLRSKNKKEQKKVSHEVVKEIPKEVQHLPPAPAPAILEARPVRECRIRKEQLSSNRMKEEEPMTNSSGRNLRNRQELEQSRSEQLRMYSQPRSDKYEVQILDYDYLIESEGRNALISPAVIPSTKPKAEPHPPPQTSPYPMSHSVSFKDMERQQYSSQEFKESEESQFILDERGKQKRKKQKMMRQQERLNRKKKSRRIKKKSKGSSSSRH